MYQAAYIFLFLCLCINNGLSQQPYLGKLIGRLSELEHLVKGDVYAVDSRTIHIKGFNYDGTAPDAYFYVGKTGKSPDNKGIIIPNEKGSIQPLGPYRNKDVTLTLPDKLTLNDIAWISIWCKAYTIDFGHLLLPRRFKYPKPQKVDALPTFDHGVSSDKIVVVDAQTFLIPNFKYDGTAPDAFFWVGKGTRPDTQGIQVADENGSLKPLKRYSGKTIVITLTDDLTVFDIDYLSIWCRAFTVNFGHVILPKNLNVPPSLKMLGVAPQTKLNCEVLDDGSEFEVRWAIAGNSIVMQLVGRVENGQYMSFGISGEDSRSVMIGGDVTVTWLDQTTGSSEAQDFHLDEKSQCQGSRGSCPDVDLGGTNDVRLLNGALINGYTMLTFQRPLQSNDQLNRKVLTRKPQAIIWAIGPINSQGHASYHTKRTKGNVIFDFGRSPTWNCPLPEEEKPRKPSRSRIQSSPLPKSAPPVADPWEIPAIQCHEPEDRVYYAQIGPTGGDHGYNAITGHVGWGISWYINGLLIPEITVVRGQEYTFVVEGGDDSKSPAKHHPFYITDDPEGGYDFKTRAERENIEIYAGIDVDRNGKVVPTAQGRYCHWKQDPNQPASTFNSFGGFQRSLTLECQEGNPGILRWTPDATTPDLVYYQCFTHRYLGWKIRVIDSCGPSGNSATGRGRSRARNRSRARG